jgi:uncharacterized membrane protein
MSADTKTVGPKPRRRWPKVLLVVSLTLNMLVLAAVAGAVLRDGRDGRDDRRGPPQDRVMLREGGFGPFFDAMPRDARRQMADAFRESGHAKGPDRAALAADFRDFVAALRAEPFVPDALDAVLDAQHARAQERIRTGRQILVEQIAGMSPAERAAFADALEDRFRKALSRAPGGAGGARGEGD